MAELVIRLLGAPYFAIDGTAVEERSRKATALMAYLAVEARPAGAAQQSLAAGQPEGGVRRDSLAAMFWPEHDQSRARAYLRNALWVLAQAGLEPWLEAGRESVAARRGFRLDTADFLARCAAGLEHAHGRSTACAECAPALEEAAALYRGDFMAGLTLEDCPSFDEWQYFQAETLRGRLAEALARLAAYGESAREWEKATAHARRWVALDPLHEPAQRALMRLYARSGQRGQALRQYETLRRTLERELGAEPEAESRQLLADLRVASLWEEAADAVEQADAVGRAVEAQGSEPQRGAQAGAQAAAPPQTPRQVPAELTSFIGREREIEAISGMLDPGERGSARLLTLTGPGGSGKTRLALKVAERAGAAFADGVFFVWLAAETAAQLKEHPERVPAAVAKALALAETPGRSITETLKESLKGRSLLLVMDNFEHVIEAAPLVPELLAAAPGLRVLATSRELLRVYGEQAYPVPPLALPSPGARADERMQSEAVRLFIDRARAVRPDFAVDGSTVEAVAEICARLDGLPLAIELAAARLRLFSLERLREQISEALDLLRGGPRDAPTRQRALRATIDWSYHLLAEDERRLFARMSAFQGGCTLEAFEQVCLPDDPAAALDGLQSLIEKSLVTQTRGRDGEPRYGMLETIYTYARGKLAWYGEVEANAARHARFFARLADEADNDLRGGPRLLSWLERLESERGNLRLALDWCLAGGDVELGLKMASALMLYWVRKDHHSEGRSYIERALDLSERAPTVLRAKLFYSCGFLAYFRQDMQACLEGYWKASELYREVDDPGGLGWALIFSGAVAAMMDPSKYRESLARSEEGFALLRALGDRPRIAQALNIVGEMARTCGDYATAKRVYEECLDLSREIGDRMRELMILQNLGYVAMHEGDYARAAELFRPALGLAQVVGSISQLAVMFMLLGGLDAGRGQAARGARLMGAGESILDTHGLVLQPADNLEVERYRAELRAVLGEEAYAAAVEEGKQMQYEEMLDAARQSDKEEGR